MSGSAACGAFDALGLSAVPEAGGAYFIDADKMSWAIPVSLSIVNVKEEKLPSIGRDECELAAPGNNVSKSGESGPVVTLLKISWLPFSCGRPRFNERLTVVDRVEIVSNALAEPLP
jgi:hypothetical protein